MLLQRVEQPFDSNDYITELKLDGIRLLLTKFNDKVRLYTRHNNEVTSLFPELYKELDIPDGTVLDGEIIVSDSEGKPDFEAMMQRFSSPKNNRPVQFCVFDIIYYKGKKVTAYSLLERKALIDELSFNGITVVPVRWLQGNAVPYFQLVQQQDLEGIVQKHIQSSYEVNKRSDKWLKVINYKYQDVLITGILKKDHSFVLSSLEDGRSLGIMEFVPNEERKRIHRLVEQAEKKETDKMIRFEKGVPCRVKFRNWTSKGKLRIPSFYKWIS